MATKSTRSRRPPTANADHPFTARLPDGRTLFVLVPAWMCETDPAGGGELSLKPEGIRLIDRAQALAMASPAKPSPAYIRTLREAMGLTQTALAARLGVNKMTVARWEWGLVAPRKDAVAALDALRKTSGLRGVAIDGVRTKEGR